MPHPLHNIAAVILGAGTSRRMGSPKQLLLLDGRPLLQHVVTSAAEARFGEVLVVLGAHAADVASALELPSDPPCRVVVNEQYADGMATSLIAGAAAVTKPMTAFAVLLGDEPRISPQTMLRVAEAFALSPRPVARAVYSSLKGEGGGGRDGAERATQPGHPVIVGRELWPAIEKLQGDEGLRSILHAHPDLVEEVAIEGPAPMDIDTEADFRALR